MAQGHSVAQCLALYPECAEELEPLLTVAGGTMRAAASVRYRTDAKARGLARLNASAAERRVRKKSRFAWLAARAPRVPRFAAAGLIAAVMVTGTAFGANVAAANSLPGDPLYWVKTTREDISMRMPKSDVEKAKAHVDLARTRSSEMTQLIDRGRMDDAEQAAVIMVFHLSESAVIVGINIPANHTEMPYIRARNSAAYELATYVESEGRINYHDARLSYGEWERRRIIAQMWKCEVRYRAILAALENDSPPAWPFLMNEPTRSRY